MKTLTYFILLLVFSGCAVRGFVPSPNFNLPETKGEQLKGRIGAGWKFDTEVEMVSNPTGTPPDDSNPKIVDSFFGRIAMDVDLGLTKYVDLSWRDGLGLTWQIWGDPAEMRGPRATIFAHQAQIMYKMTESSTVETNTTSSSNQVGTSIGFRTTPTMLVYGSFVHSDYKLKAEIKQPSQTYKFDGTGDQNDLMVGLNAGSGNFFFQLEYGVRETTYNKVAEKHWGSAAAVLLGGSW